MQRIARPFRTAVVQPLLQAPTPAVTSSSRLPFSSPLKKTAAPAAARMSSTAAAPVTSADAFLAAVKNRRTIYTLNKDLPISTDRVQKIVKTLLQDVPSSFNSQSNRVLVLFGAEHDKFWDITLEILRGIVPEAQFASTEARIGGFRSGAGTVLFFEDWPVVEGMQAKFALYADRFPVWAGHSDAMLQFAVWTALEAEGLGANLQHYNPLVDSKVAEEWKVPPTWKLVAQLVFGGKSGEAGDKIFGPLEEKYKVFGA